MYQSLEWNPIDRFSLGRASEINRDELKFNKFTNRLQMKFSRVFTDILRTQLILKNIVKPEEFDGFSDFIKYDFASDNHFTELKDAEIMRERMDTMQNVSEYVGKYFSIDYVRRNILMQSEDDIEKMNKQIEQEKNDGLYGDDEEF